MTIWFPIFSKSKKRCLSEESYPKIQKIDEHLSVECALTSGENFTEIWKIYLTKIILNEWSMEHDFIVKTFENHLLKSLCSEASWKQLKVSCGGERIREISTPFFREALKIINSLYYSNFSRYVQWWGNRKRRASLHSNSMHHSWSITLSVNLQPKQMSFQIVLQLSVIVNATG